MEEIKPTLCTICLEVKGYENCRVIEDIFQGVLKTLLFKRTVEVNKSTICNACYFKVFEAFRFKRICTNTEDSLFPYVHFRNGVPVDMEEIYMRKVNKQELRCILDCHKICRLCMKLVISGFTSVKDLEVDLICKYIPEVNFSSTNDPIICEGCVYSVKTYGSFLREHFDVRKYETIENICKEDTMEGQFHIKKEEIEIKSEEDYQNTGTLPSTDELPSCKANDEDSPKIQPLEKKMYECNTCAYRSASKQHLTSHLLTHKKLSEVPTYKCCECDYVTKRRSNLLNHQLKHKDISEIQIYKCDRCKFKTKHKESIAQHQKRHRSIPKVQIFKCDTCIFETQHKRTMVIHQKNHHGISKTQIYRCDMCDFQSRHNRSMVNHQGNHVYISNGQTYKCDKCNFESKHEADLIKHRLVHIFHTSSGQKKCRSVPATAVTGRVGQRNHKTSVKVNVVSVNILRKS